MEKQKGFSKLMQIPNRLRTHLRLWMRDKDGTARKVQKRNLTYLSPRKLVRIIDELQRIEKQGVSGLCIEAGCALGGSTLVIASHMPPDRHFYIYDTFEMIPPPTDEDPPEVHERYRAIVNGESKGIGGDLYYGYRSDLYEFVERNLCATIGNHRMEQMHLTKGLLQETMQVEEPVAFAHIDVDWYDPVHICIERIWPRVSLGGVMIFDDYRAWGGCRKAVDTYFADRTDANFDQRAGNLVVERTS